MILKESMGMPFCIQRTPKRGQRKAKLILNGWKWKPLIIRSMRTSCIAVSYNRPHVYSKQHRQPSQDASWQAGSDARVPSTPATDASLRTACRRGDISRNRNRTWIPRCGPCPQIGAERSAERTLRQCGQCDSP